MPLPSAPSSSLRLALVESDATIRQLLLDLSLPGQSGLQALPTLLAGFSVLQLLVQTSNNAADTIDQALRLGVRGCVAKSATPLPAYRLKFSPTNQL